MIGKKLLSYKLEDGSMIEFTNAMSGFGRVYVNGEEVSKQRGFGGESHNFEYKDSTFQINVWPLISMHILGLSIELIRNDERLVLYGSESRPKSWIVFLGALAVGVLLGISIMSFILES
ncbi:MAG: hypothetical protein VYB52_04910 [Candidatus Neomarinimicrobiota bacterium]|nr:hypothetical protein [Candidatus Neomarinimicrobiota bacterium]MEC9474817.1 hypothetical protein [Candidatus Neomarinimicrobiota bacterium]MED5434174.1 hypothetical protein [Candidatus Neomarinimicrobiota bacterium]|tara:strand:+ start:1992 stop:2348 length:357 start_codon:yes stop_codon:yes gene_type:complete